MAQRFAYEVRMTRPDRRRVVVRRCFRDEAIAAVSNRQLAGYLTHTLLSDTERGGVGTHYTITERDVIDGGVDVFTVERTEAGFYVHA